jgi:hypothetical protein
LRPTQGDAADQTDAEYTTLRSEAVVALPSNLDKAEMAPLLCAGITVFNGIRKMDIEQGGTVAVQGLGGLGHLAVQYARKMGYRTVALSSSDSKRKFATDLGATDYVDGSKEKTVDVLQKMGGADLIVVTAPNPNLITDLPWALAPMGKVLVLARQPPLLHSQARLTVPASGRRHHRLDEPDDHEGRLRARLALGPRARQRGGHRLRAAPGRQLHGRAVPAGQGAGGRRPHAVRQSALPRRSDDGLKQVGVACVVFLLAGGNCR